MERIFNRLLLAGLNNKNVSYKIIQKENGKFTFKEFNNLGGTVRIGKEEFKTEEDAQSFVDDNFLSKGGNREDKQTDIEDKASALTDSEVEPDLEEKVEEKTEKPEKPKSKSRSKK